MTKLEIDKYFNRNWNTLHNKGLDIHRNLNGKGSADDLIQEAYLYIQERPDMIMVETSIEAFFVRYISQQIKWTRSKHNRDLKRCDPPPKIRMNLTILAENIETDVDDKVDFHLWYTEIKCVVELYKQEKPYNKLLFDMFMEEGGNLSKLAERLKLTKQIVWVMTTKMKEELTKMRDRMRDDACKLDKVKGSDPDHYLVAGCGPSIKTVIGKDLRSVPVIGVNDVVKHLPIDYHVVVDPLKSFNSDRANIIMETKSKMLFSHLPAKHLMTESEERCHLEFLQARGFKPFDNLLPKSTHSTFVAACVAISLGAKSLAFAGMDIIGHPNWTSAKKITQTRTHLSQLVAYAISNGIDVYNLGEPDNILGGIEGVKQVTYKDWMSEITWKSLL